MADAPYFSFWAKDWLTGEGTRLMTPEQKGAFIDLLSHAWLSSSEPCTLPSDEPSLAKLSGLGRRWAKVGAAVLAQFEPTESGRLRNAKLYDVWVEMEERHGRRVAAGAKGGKAKAERVAKPKQSDSNARAMLKQPKPKPKAKTETTPSASASPPAGDAGPNLFRLAPFLESWREKFGGDPPAARFGKVFKRLVVAKGYGEAEVLRRWLICLDVKGDFATPEELAAKWDRYAVGRTAQGERNYTDPDAPGYIGLRDGGVLSDELHRLVYATRRA
jgi:uncharacterized protein YdaU (DUF1376 family)